MFKDQDVLKEDLVKAYTYPKELGNLTQKLETRIKKEKRRKSVVYSSFSLVAASIFFVLLVNFSTTFVYALSDIPILNRISQFVLFDESLKSALENDYIQYVGLKETSDEEVLKLPYVIADEQSIILFFQTEEDSLPENEYYEVRLDSFKNRATGKIITEGYSSSSHIGANKSPEDLGLKHIRVNFVDLSLFKEIDVNVTLSKLMSNDVGFTTLHEDSFTFSITLDEFPQPIIYPINEKLFINDIDVVIDTMEVYPTTTLIHYKTSNQNNDELYLEFELNDDGKIINLPETNSYFFSNENFDEHTIRIEDNFFNQPKSRSLILSGYSYISEDDKYITLDAKNKTLSRPIPEVKMDDFTYEEDTIFFTLSTELQSNYAPIRYIENETKTEYIPYYLEQSSNQHSNTFLYKIESKIPIILLKMQPVLTELGEDRIEIPINKKEEK